MEISNLIPHIESLVFASDKPLTSLEITDLVNQAFGFMEEKISIDQIEASLEGIVEKYNSEFYPFEVRQSGGGWQFLTKKEFHKTVAQLNGEKFLKRLSSAALETLAIVAYKQPVTKGEIESIRGVSSDYAMQKLLEKELIVITGRNEKLPGHPLVYTTSKNFMDYFGINSPEDLPKIREVLADQLVEATIVHHTDFEPGQTPGGDSELVMVEQPGATDEEAFVNGHTIKENGEEIAGDESTDDSVNDDTTSVDVPTESLEDEIVQEEYISDEIFVAEDEIVAEQQIEEELSMEIPGDEASENNDNANPLSDEGTKE
jgi:segregation and condensation protein B